MPDALYVPVLKGRQGELAALSLIQPMTRQHVLPVLEIVPGPGDDAYNAAPQLRSIIEKTARRLQTWAGQRLLLDAGLLTTEMELRDGFGALGFSIAAALDQGVSATPVVRLDDGLLALHDARTWHADTRCGIAVRLGAKDLDEDAEDIDTAVTDLLRDLEVDRKQVDLVLDIGPAIGDLMVRAGSRLAADALRALTNPDDFREIIVTAGAFPPDLTDYPPWEIGEPVRYDAALYDHLRQRRRLPRIPAYGDYAVTNPILVTGLPYRASPQLRYTLADRWLVLKGGRNDPRGHDQFYDICERIAAHPDFVGAALGNADARIADSRAKGPGNASTWREIGTAHHLDYVVRRLTSLDEP
jgi:Beta protein